MASKELQAKFENYEEYIKRKGIDEKVIDYYCKASEYAITQEKDIEYGLEKIKRSKEIINEWLNKNTKFNDIWAVEKEFYGKQNVELVERYYSLLKNEAFYKLDSFIYYMEKNREPSKRFYLPRKQTLEIVCRDLEDLENRVIKFYGLSMPSRVGKLISDDTPVLTENGWKKHGDLEVGDYVYDFDGQLVKVVYVHPKNYANKRVTFSDGTHIDCHENHEWILYDRVTQGEFRVETKYVEEHLKTKESGKDRNRWYLPLKAVLQGSCMKKLAVPPYVLGAWLGDGTNRKPTLTICDTDTVIVDEIVRLGYKQTTKFSQVGCAAYSFENLRQDLHTYGMCMRDYATEKHIPEDYLNATVEQRLELLAGLLDTDGTLVKKEHRYQFTTTSEQLKNDFIALVSTFGWRVSVSVRKAGKTSSSGITSRNDTYCIGFNPTFHIPCKLERKQLWEFSKQRRIAVENIEDIEPVSGNCITVMGGTYRVGERMIPTHNSTICIFFLAWIALKRPNSHSAMGGHSGILAKGFYKELSNLFITEEYTFKELFEYYNPKYAGKKLPTSMSADEFTLTLGDPDRFATITCRGIDGTWTGAVDVSSDGYLYVDDLVRDREHSLSPMRMENTFQEYLNKMVDRKIDGARELMVGTLWNVLDPLARLKEMYANNPLYRFRKIPALNEKDESNFAYEINGFSTEWYRDMRERLDNAEWMAKYQQQPYVREGLLFPSNELQYFNGLLPEDERKIIALCDPAFGGADRLSMPIVADFGDKKRFVIDWVHKSGTQAVTVPLIVDKIIKHYITELHIEQNAGGKLITDSIKAEMQRRDCRHCNIVPYYASTKLPKDEKIKGYSDWVKSNFMFLMPNTDEVANEIIYKRSEQYELAMAELCMYTAEGKNAHDDSADAITQLAIVIGKKKNKARIMASPI